MEGLYSGLGGGAGMTAQQLDAKIKLLVEAPAAVEDALASLLDHHDSTLQVHNPVAVNCDIHCSAGLLLEMQSKLESKAPLIQARVG